MRTDRYDDNRVKLRFDDRATATERVGGRTGGCCDDEAVPRVRVHILTGHARFKIDHAACFATLQNDVI